MTVKDYPMPVTEERFGQAPCPKLQRIGHDLALNGDPKTRVDQKPLCDHWCEMQQDQQPGGGDQYADSLHNSNQHAYQNSEESPEPKRARLERSLSTKNPSSGRRQTPRGKKRCLTSADRMNSSELPSESYEQDENYLTIRNNRYDSGVLALMDKLPSCQSLPEMMNGERPSVQLAQLPSGIQVLTAAQHFDQGQYIVELLGDVAVKSAFDALNPRSSGVSPFVFIHQVESNTVVVDARTFGNVARFIRRSCSPNTQIQHHCKDQDLHFLLVSIAPISCGSEILIPAHPEDDLGSSSTCHCGGCCSPPHHHTPDLTLSKKRRAIRRSLLSDSGDTDQEKDADTPSAPEQPTKVSREERKIQQYVRIIEGMDKSSKKKTETTNRRCSKRRNLTSTSLTIPTIASDSVFQDDQYDAGSMPNTPGSGGVDVGFDDKCLPESFSRRNPTTPIASETGTASPPFTGLVSRSQDTQSGAGCVFSSPLSVPRSERSDDNEGDNQIGGPDSEFHFAKTEASVTSTEDIGDACNRYLSSQINTVLWRYHAKEMGARPTPIPRRVLSGFNRSDRTRLVPGVNKSCGPFTPDTCKQGQTPLPPLQRLILRGIQESKCCPTDRQPRTQTRMGHLVASPAASSLLDRDIPSPPQNRSSSPAGPSPRGEQHPTSVVVACVRAENCDSVISEVTDISLDVRIAAMRVSSSSGICSEKQPCTQTAVGEVNMDSGALEDGSCLEPLVNENRLPLTGDDRDTPPRTNLVPLRGATKVPAIWQQAQTYPVDQYSAEPLLPSSASSSPRTDDFVGTWSDHHGAPVEQGTPISSAPGCGQVAFPQDSGLTTPYMLSTYMLGSDYSRHDHNGSLNLGLKKRISVSEYKSRIRTPSSNHILGSITSNDTLSSLQDLKGGSVCSWTDDNASIHTGTHIKPDASTEAGFTQSKVATVDYGDAGDMVSAYREPLSPRQCSPTSVGGSFQYEPVSPGENETEFKLSIPVGSGSEPFPEEFAGYPFDPKLPLAGKCGLLSVPKPQP